MSRAHKQESEGVALAYQGETPRLLPGGNIQPGEEITVSAGEASAYLAMTDEQGNPLWSVKQKERADGD